MDENNNYNLFGEGNNEKSLEQKNKDLDKKLISLYRLHSSKFHKIKNTKTSDDLLNIHVNIFKKSNQEKISNPRNIDNSMTRFRKKIAFKFRFINSLNNISPKKQIASKFKSQTNKMNKILKFSKSIPDVLLNEFKTIQSDDKINNNNKIKYQYQIQTNNNTNNNIINGYIGNNSSFKANRYSGNIYDYYKSDRPIYVSNNLFKIEKKFNFEENTTNNDININNNKFHNDKLKILNNDEKYNLASIKKNKLLYNRNQDNKYNKEDNKTDNIKNLFYNNKLKKLKISKTKSKSDSIIKLSSLLS